MQTQFLKYIQENDLFGPGQRILLAVSGGIDSMVLLNLFNECGFNFDIAHCNFRLRGTESDRDEKFVRDQAAISGVRCYVNHFNTEEYALLNGISIEMAARKLRYEWFEQVRGEMGYAFIATAHQKDDNIETFFLNLSRKTGIRGLTGIKPVNGHIIRPLLFASRMEIEKYAQKHFIDFCNDSTNDDTQIKRNFIRHKIIPDFEKINPSFRKSIAETIDILSETENFYSCFVSGEMAKISKKVDERVEIDIEKLKNLSFPKLVLYEILKDYGFKAQIAEKIFRGIDSISGKYFYSPTHKLLKDRNVYYILPLSQDENHLYYIEEDDEYIQGPFRVDIQKNSVSAFVIENSNWVACLDYDKLSFPLLVRKWQKGDYFQPLGMKGLKKISDFLIDKKIPLYQKENTWVICSNNKIVWVVGLRIDDRFKVTENTRSILKLTLEP